MPRPLLGAAVEIEPLLGTADADGEATPLLGTTDADGEAEPLLGITDADGEVELLVGTRGVTVVEGLLSEFGAVDGEVVGPSINVHLESTRRPLTVGDTQASRVCVVVE